jgi:flavorubredoxin
VLPETLAVQPQEIATDTWLVPTFAPDPAGGFVGAHSMVIRGAEPVIVDTGCALLAEDWQAKAFSVVDPADVRWVFLSHDDHDHVGNVEAVLERCPQATLVVNFAIAARLTGSIDLPLDRMRFLDPGQPLELPDRTLTAVRPPMFDSPATRGLFDSATGLLWAADAFGALVQGEVYDADDVDPALYDGSFAVLNSWNTPWLEWVDVARFQALVQTTIDLPLQAVASAHGPVHRGEKIADAFRRTLDLAAQPMVPMPGQELLDLVLAGALA